MPKTITKQPTAIHSFVPGSSRGPRSSATFRDQMAKAMEAERRALMAERIRELRGPVPQPVVADRIGVSLRGYQEWEGGRSAPSWDNIKKLAEVHDVDENYILYGNEPDEPAPSEPIVTSSAELQAIRDDVTALREDVAQIVDLMQQLLDPLHGLLQAQAGIDPQGDAPASKPSSRKAARGGRRVTA